MIEPAQIACQAFDKCIEAAAKQAANAEVVSTVIDAPKRTAQTVKVPGCFVRIQGSYVSLRAAEQRVADFILKYAEELIYLTVTELAERTQTSESTVVRLCQKIGYKGYQEFKIVLARDLVEPTDAIYERIEEIDAVATATRVEIYGVGGSGSIAVDAYHKCLKLGIPAIALSDSDLMGMSAALLRPGTVALGISHTGMSRDVCEALELAKSGGATTICITHRATSPITRVADIKLFTAAKETAFRSDAMSSRIAQLSIIDTVYVGVALKDYQRSTQTIAQTREATAKKRY
jgi:DNA-binding MurR/RpiR family transcriptional regulator